MKLKHTDRRTQIPSGREIFGCFVESGFGRQVSGMWSEMLFNRAFREIVPYKAPMWQGIGVDHQPFRCIQGD